MKTLSVQFYKRLILLALALMILIPTVLAVVFGIQNSALREQLTAAGLGAGLSAEGTRPPAELTGSPIGYQELYPELYSSHEIAPERIYRENTVYLTFNSTPGENTEAILNVLDDYGIKATFFLSGVEDPAAYELMRTIVQKGHTIGLNGYSDSYQQIYGSVESFLEDFKAIYTLVYETTGVKAEIFRYPGGSINAYNSGFYQELNGEMLRRNFIFFDWDVSGEDTLIEGADANRIRERVLAGMENKNRGIVLLRDAVGKEAVVEALPGIIEGLQSRGYEFHPLTADVMPVVFSYKGAP